MSLECESATSKVWSRIGKTPKPRDTIIELKTLDSPLNAPVYESRSDKMAELARDYHESLQNKDLASAETTTR
ncbi:hypothetical protein BDR03DRAFT_957582 [Suillus americanus]|nr:hypothetical protein BDR03DRAFT_957582 [Suillus americanus]